jgi:hypothetical protein
MFLRGEYETMGRLAEMRSKGEAITGSFVHSR